MRETIIGTADELHFAIHGIQLIHGTHTIKR